MIGLHKLRLVSADALGGGTRDETPRVSAWEAKIVATVFRNYLFTLSFFRSVCSD